MTVESASYIADLNASYPASGDQKKEGDDHIRLIKTVIKATINGWSGNVLMSGSDTGTANNYALTPSPALVAYTTNMMVLLVPANTNTTASTLAISGLTAKGIKDVDGNALTANDLVAGSAYLLFYDGTYFNIVSGPTKNYVDQLSFSSSLPAQTGHDGHYLTTDGVNAWWDDVLASPDFTGAPTAPTAAVDTNTTQIATTAFVIGQLYAKLAGPTFTGNVTVPTLAADATSGYAINAAWYSGQAGTANPQANGSASAGTSKKWSPIDHVHPTDTSRAPTAGPTFTGNVTVPTLAIDATTAYAINATWYDGQKGTASPQMNGSAYAGTSKRWTPQDHVHPTDTSRAPLASPSFTGTVTLNNASGDTGGAITLKEAVTNSNLAGDVVFDVYRDTIRVWENGGTSRGAFIDLTACDANSAGYIFHNGIAATQSQMEAGTSNAVPVTPGNLKWHQSVAKAWVTNDASANISCSYNITSISDLGTGYCQANFDVDFSVYTAKCGVCAVDQTSTQAFGNMIRGSNSQSSNMECCSITGSLTDPDFYQGVWFGDQ